MAPDSLDAVVELDVGDADVLRQIPGQADHGHDGLVALQLVVLIALHAQGVLAICQGTHVPCNVVAPALRKPS